MKVYLIRHGQSEANVKRMLAGCLDAQLTKTGKRQAAEVAKKLQGVRLDAIYSSDLQRAHQTALSIAEGRDIDVTIRAGLRERNFGEWEGRTFEDIQREEPDAWARFLDPMEDHIPGAESRTALHQRVVKEYQDILSAYDPDADVNICIVAHACVLMTLMSEIVYGNQSGYFRFEIQNSKVNMLEYVMKYPVIKAINA